MKNEKYNTEAIRDYLMDKTPKELKAEIEESMLEDPELAYEINVQKTLLAGIEVAFDQRLKNELRGQDDEKIKQFKISRPLLVAASFTILLITYFIYQSLSVSIEQKLFDEYYLSYYNVVDDQRRGVADKVDTESPYLYYEHLQYEMAIGIFEELLKNDPENLPATLYCGLSYLETNKLESAIRKLKAVANTQHPFNEAAKWYLGLTYLKKRDVILAKQILSEVTSDKSAYSERAHELLLKLD